MSQKEKEVVSRSLDFNYARWTQPSPRAVSWLLLESWWSLHWMSCPWLMVLRYLWAWLRSSPRSWVKRCSGQDSELLFDLMRETGGNLEALSDFLGRGAGSLKVSVCILKWAIALYLDFLGGWWLPLIGNWKMALPWELLQFQGWGCTLLRRPQ